MSGYAKPEIGILSACDLDKRFSQFNENTENLKKTFGVLDTFVENIVETILEVTGNELILETFNADQVQTLSDLTQKYNDSITKTMAVCKELRRVYLPLESSTTLLKQSISCKEREEHDQAWMKFLAYQKKYEELDKAKCEEVTASLMTMAKDWGILAEQLRGALDDMESVKAQAEKQKKHLDRMWYTAVVIGGLVIAGAIGLTVGSAIATGGASIVPEVAVMATVGAAGATATGASVLYAASVIGAAIAHTNKILRAASEGAEAMERTIENVDKLAQKITELKDEAYRLKGETEEVATLAEQSLTQVQRLESLTSVDEKVARPKHPFNTIPPEELIQLKAKVAKLEETYDDFITKCMALETKCARTYASTLSALSNRICDLQKKAKEKRENPKTDGKCTCM